MKPMPNVVIVPGRCSHSKSGFGIRFEEITPKKWEATWAFSINEKSAQREGYGNHEIKGALDFGQTYPGCPHCSAESCVKCECGKVGCWDVASECFTCPYCGSSGEVSGKVDSLTASGDS